MDELDYPRYHASARERTFFADLCGHCLTNDPRQSRAQSQLKCRSYRLGFGKAPLHTAGPYETLVAYYR